MGEGPRQERTPTPTRTGSGTLEHQQQQRVVEQWRCVGCSIDTSYILSALCVSPSRVSCWWWYLAVLLGWRLVVVVGWCLRLWPPLSLLQYSGIEPRNACPR